MDRPPPPSPRPFAVVAFGWLWVTSSLAQLAWVGFLIFVGGFHGANGVQLFLSVILLLGGMAVAKGAVIPIESGLVWGTIFGLGLQGLRLFNGVQDGAVSLGVALMFAFDLVQGLALLLLRTPTARAWMESNWAVVQAHFAKR